MRSIVVTMLAVLAALSVAQDKPAAKTKAPKEIACAVMKGGKVNVAKAEKAKMFADYKGRRYYFCCAGCPEAFKKNPSKYAKNASLPAPKPAPKKKAA